MESRSLLNALGWADVLEGLAHFCSTEGGADLCRSLRPAGDRILAERLQAETALAGAAEAGAGAPLDFGAWGLASNALLSVRGARRTGTPLLAGHQLRSVADLLMVGEALGDRLKKVSAHNPGGLGRFVLSPGEADEVVERLFTSRDTVESLSLAREVYRCLGGDGSVLDEADETVARSRRDLKSAEKALDELVGAAAAAAVAVGATRGLSADECLAVVRGRRCIVLAAGRSDAVGGGVTLGKSKTAMTLYVEPREAVALNNSALNAAAEENSACRRVLARLSELVAGEAVGKGVEDCAALVARIDCAAARARFAAWAGGVRPEFGETRAFEVEGLCHPGLICKDGAAELNARDPARLHLCAARDDGSRVWLRRGTSGVVPIDVAINAEVRCVTITGANAGGKTMALKCIGLAGAMARAGIFLCIQDGLSLVEMGKEAGGRSTDAAAAAANVGLHTRPVLPFYDRILADIGDPQSLADDLSTFSGHLVQVASIIEASTPDTLVLLDEVGDGTDPADGAAFAEAILRHLALKVGCTVLASSHYGRLKGLPGEVFKDASVEFDSTTLMPTHRLLWGVPGESHALDLASRLGLPLPVLSAAQAWMANCSAEGKGGDGSVEDIALIRQLREALDDEMARASDSQGELESLNLQLEAAKGDLLRAAGIDLSANMSLELNGEFTLQKLMDKAERAGAADVRELCTETVASIRKLGENVKEDLDAAIMESAAGDTAAIAFKPDENATKSKGRKQEEREEVWSPRKGERVCVPAMGNLVVVIKAVKKGGLLEVEGTQGLLQGQNLRLTRDEVAPYS